MERVTRSTALTVKRSLSKKLQINQENNSPEIAENDNKTDLQVDLSKFKFKKSDKVPSSKRQHIQIEYDGVISPEPLKKSPNIVQSKTPLNWEEVLKNLREMRKDMNAPVDTMGCEQCHDKGAIAEDKRFQTLLSLMLSSQTKDQVTHAAMLRLREHGCSLSNILNTSDEELGKLIYPVGFWKTKVKYIRRTVQMLRNDFNGDIPRTVEDLCKLPGVGPKMAHLCMKSAWAEITGIAVDTHVHRITNRLGWVNTKTPEQTRKALENWLPHEVWNEINYLLVGFGQQICQPVKPQCQDCLNNKLCPFGVRNIRMNKGKTKK